MNFLQEEAQAAADGNSGQSAPQQYGDSTGNRTVAGAGCSTSE
jgi:hypothetical protein